MLFFDFKNLLNNFPNSHMCYKKLPLVFVNNVINLFKSNNWQQYVNGFE